MWSCENLCSGWNAIAVSSTQSKASIAIYQHGFTAKHKVCTHLISKNASLRISVPSIIRLNFPHFLFLKPCWILSFLKSTPVILIPLSQNYWQSNLSIMNKKQTWRKVFYSAFFVVLSVSFLSPKSFLSYPKSFMAMPLKTTWKTEYVRSVLVFFFPNPY